MAYKQTAWTYSNESLTPTLPQAGMRIVLIRGAQFYEASEEKSAAYRLDLKDLEDETEFSVYHHLTYSDGSSNNRSKAALISLNKALFEEDSGFPNPVDVVGGVVGADVELQPGKEDGKVYIKVNGYAPAAEAYVMSYGSIEQYFIGREERRHDVQEARGGREAPLPLHRGGVRRGALRPQEEAPHRRPRPVRSEGAGPRLCRAVAERPAGAGRGRPRQRAEKRQVDVHVPRRQAGSRPGGRRRHTRGVLAARRHGEIVGRGDRRDGVPRERDAPHRKDAGHDRRGVPATGQPEAELKHGIRALLEEEGAFWSNVAGGAFSKPGDPDIVACHRGRYVAVEAKTPRGSLSEFQKARRDEIERAGGVYVVARSVEDVRRALEAVP